MTLATVSRTPAPIRRAVGVSLKAGARAMENRFFFPDAALNEWIVGELVDVRGGELTIRGEGRRYALAESVRIVREVSGSVDLHDLIGRVKVRAALEQLGAEIVETSMLVGEAAYDVEPGWV